MCQQHAPKKWDRFIIATSLLMKLMPWQSGYHCGPLFVYIPPVFRDFLYAISIAGSRLLSPDPHGMPGLQPSKFPQGNGYPHKGTVDGTVAD